MAYRPVFDCDDRFRTGGPREIGTGGAGLNADRFYPVAQNALLSVCGTIGNECCENNCTQDNVDRPILPVSGWCLKCHTKKPSLYIAAQNCQRRPQMEHWHRFLLTIYVAVAIGSTQLVLDREAWGSVYEPVGGGFFM